MIFDPSIFMSAVADLPGAITFVLIFGLALAFSSQIIAWVTGPNPKFLHAIAIGMLVSAFWTWVIYNFLPLGPALVRASIHGIYGNWGYLWTFSIVVLMFVFGINAFNSWKENKPLELIQ